MDELFPNEASVTEPQKQALRGAILHAYPNFDFLYLRLSDKWGFRVDDYMDTRRGKALVIEDIVRQVVGEGRLLDLLAVTWSDKPHNPRLKALADELLVDQAGVLAKYAPAPAIPAAVTATRPSLEKLVETRSRLLNLAQFQQGIERLSDALCRISAPTVKGTGFLVGRRTVLTNFHVMQEAIQQSLDGSKLLFEFDFSGRTASIFASGGGRRGVERPPSALFAQRPDRGRRSRPQRTRFRAGDAGIGCACRSPSAGLADRAADRFAARFHRHRPAPARQRRKYRLWRGAGLARIGPALPLRRDHRAGQFGLAGVDAESGTRRTPPRRRS